VQALRGGREGAMKYEEQENALSLLASATDLLNSWAREMAVKEAHDESDIKGVIDRLWNELSTEMSRSTQKGALIRQMLKDSPNPSVQNVLEAIEGS
jgi:hypothetical protein